MRRRLIVAREALGQLHVSTGRETGRRADRNYEVWTNGESDEAAEQRAAADPLSRAAERERSASRHGAGGGRVSVCKPSWFIPSLQLRRRALSLSEGDAVVMLSMAVR